MKYTATIGGPHPTGRTGCLPCPYRKHGYTGGPCSRSSTSPLFRDTMILCRRWWNSCLTCSAFFGRSHLIEVPKILPEDVPFRAVVREPQLAEQLVEVPTIVSNSWLQLRTEQNVEFPIGGGLHDFLPHLHLLHLQLVFMDLQMGLVQVFFALFTKI